MRTSVETSRAASEKRVRNSPETASDSTVQPDAEEGPAEKQNERAPVAIAEASGSDDFPDGGLRAWLVVLGSWLISACSFGYISSFAVYQGYYEANQLSDETPSNIAWIGSLQLFLIFFSGIFTGYLFDIGYCRHILAAGSCLLVVALFTTAECESLWQFVLAQGIVGGLGAGLVFLPSAAVLSHWFRKKRALSYGIIATGSSMGGVLFPIMLNRLFPQVGFKWAVRIAAFVMLACLITANILIRPRLPPRQRGSFIELHHFKDPAFSLLVAAAFFIILGIYTPIFYISTYAESKGVETTLAFYILAILNACSILGRLIPNIFADKIGPQNILYPASALAGVLCFVFFIPETTGSIIAFAVFYGPASGAYVSTIPACVANLTTNMSEIGMRTSLGFMVISFAALAGTPITGALQTSTGGYVAPACFAGAVVLLGVAIGLVGRQIQARRTGTWKV